MFRYPIDNRMSIVSELVEWNRANQREIARLQSELDMAQSRMRKMSPRSSQPLRSPARATARLSRPPSPVSSTIQQEVTSTPQRVQFRFVQKLPKI